MTSHTYTLRFPFEIDGNRELSGLERMLTRTVDSLALQLKREDPFYVILVDGFGSESEAKRYIRSIWAGLTRVLLELSVTWRASFDLATIIPTDDPIEAARNSGLTVDRIDAYTDGHLPSIYPSNSRVLKCTALGVTVLLSNPAEKFLDCFMVGANTTNVDAVFGDQKLRIALDLYRAHFTETSMEAKFLTLLMALECLKEQESQRHPKAVELLEKWEADVETALKSVEPGSDGRSALEYLRDEVVWHRQASIISRIRDLVVFTLAESADEQLALTATVNRVYRWRSKLVHNGDLPRAQLQRGYKDSRDLVSRLLKAKLRVAWV